VEGSEKGKHEKGLELFALSVIQCFLFDGCDTCHGDQLDVELMNWEEHVTDLLDDNHEENVDQEVYPVLLIKSWAPHKEESHAKQHRVE
jgi:hypothetical protein